jgi:hypothetical protein
MRIPTNSTFTKEISKQFKRIFHKDMTLGSLEQIKNLQENDLINPVNSLFPLKNLKSYPYRIFF